MGFRVRVRFRFRVRVIVVTVRVVIRPCISVEGRNYKFVLQETVKTEVYVIK